MQLGFTAVVVVAFLLCTSNRFAAAETHGFVVLLEIERTANPQRPWAVDILSTRLQSKYHRDASASGNMNAVVNVSDILSNPDRQQGVVDRFYASATQQRPHVGVYLHGTDSTQLVHALDVVALHQRHSVEHFDTIRTEWHDHSEPHQSEKQRGALRGSSAARNTTTYVISLANALSSGFAHTSESIGVTTVMSYGPDSGSGAPHPRPAFRSLSYSQPTQLLMQQRGIVVTTLQQVNPRLTRSIVFLAAGYRLFERTKFNANVSSCIAALRGEDPSIDPAPWSRYRSLLNIYSIFEPSIESGASRPVGPNYDCSGMKVCGPVDNANNLGCRYGTPDPGRLSCSAASILSLASFAPSADIIVVLVNDVDYGGSSFASVATIAAAPLYMTYLLIHELNHAVGGLGDEFSYGFPEPNPAAIALPPNCAATSDSAIVDWNHWIGTGSVPAQPTPGCTFSNLYRPTNSSCLMSSATATSMCSVCKERLSTRLFLGGVGMRLDAPRCPAPNFEIYMNASDSVTLAINHFFVLENAQVTVLWTLPDGSTVASVSTVTVPGSMLSAGFNSATVVVTDTTPYVRPTRRLSSMTLTSTFALRLWQPSVGCTWTSFTSSSGVAYSYCGVCTSSSGCGADVLVTPVTYAQPAPKSLEQEETTVSIVAIVLAAAGFLILLFVAIVYGCCTSKTPQRVYDRTHSDGALAFAVMLTAAISLALAVVMIVFVVVYLPRAAVFGNGAFIGVIILAAAVYLLSILKLSAGVFQAPVVVAVCGVTLCLFGIGLFGIGLFALYVYRNEGTADLVKTFADLWLSYTESHPDLICDIQRSFTCSGFYYGCTPTASSYCPSNCAAPNRDYVDPCMDPWMAWVADKSLRVGVVALLCGFFFAIAAVIDCLHCVRSIRARASAKGRRSYRKDDRAPVVPITTDEVKQVRREFAKVTGKKKDGTLEGVQVIEFLEAVFGDMPPPQEKQLLVSAGPLTCEELLRLYFPHFIISQIDPRLLTPEEAEDAKDAVDLQRLQYAKLEAFMAAAGSLSPEALQTIYMQYTEKHFVTNSKEILDIIRSASLAHNATEEAAMCSGLSKSELEGLRCAWATINPKISGTLDDDQLDHLFQWTHGTILHSHEHFVRWKDMLDVRQCGTIGWGEFCYPFAQRARLARAREYLFSIGREVPHELLSKAAVAEEFGPGLVEQCFMVFEEAIPVERIVEQALKNQEATIKQRR